MPDYPTLLLFERGDAWPWVGLVLVVAGLIVLAEAAKRWRVVAGVLFLVIPVILTITWWPHSTAGTASAGWFPIVKVYSALAGSLALVGGQMFPKWRRSLIWQALLPLILAINIAEAVVRDFQCYSIHGVDPTQGMWTMGGPWNIMNGVAGILNLVAICGWMGIIVSRKKGEGIIWPDMTWLWIIAYDLWNFAYLYNCLADRAWYSGLALLLACTIPAALLGRGSWIQYRAYTLALWSMFVVTFPHFTQDSVFALRSSHNTTLMFVVSAVALLVNLWLVWVHVRTIVTKRRNPFVQEIYPESAYFASLVRENATPDDAARIAARAGSSVEELGFVPADDGAARALQPS